MTHETRQVLEVAPEVVDLFERTVHNTRSARMNSLFAVAELHRADHVEQRNGGHIRRRESDSSAFCFRCGACDSKTDEIECVSGNARPHRLSWLLLRKNRDPRSEFAQTV